ncbi:hypothetical protein DOJK_02339 [Patescibacteria group bacterium]|nr:hypothetical protein DOJK_02339 [Patescibacteria group bacterium]
MKKIFLVGIFIGVLVSAAAALGYLVYQNSSSLQRSQVGIQQLVKNNRWYLQTLDGETPHKIIYFELDENERANGFSGCNTFFGAYSLNNWQLTFSELAATKKACLDIIDLETDFLAALEEVESFKLSNNKLILKSDYSTLVFVSNINIVSGIIGKWEYVRSVENNIEKTKLPNTLINLEFDINGNLNGEACNLISGTYKIGAEGTTLEFTAATTQRFCISPEGIMEQESLFLDNLSNVKGFRINGAILKLYYTEADYLEFTKVSNIEARTFTDTLSTSRTSINVELEKEEFEANEIIEFSIIVEPDRITSRTINDNPATGTVTLFENEQQLIEPTLLLNLQDLSKNGITTVELNNLSAGAHIITARYSGDANYLPTESKPIVLTVQSNELNNTSTILDADTLTLTKEDAVTFTAQVTDGINSYITGQIDFFDNGKLIATVEINVNESATYSTNSLKSGTHLISAKYKGDLLNNSSFSNTLSIVVNQDPQTTTAKLTSDKNNLVVGQTTTLTFQTVGEATIPTGNVEFYDNNKLVGTATLSETGSAVIVLRVQEPGEHTLSGYYKGDSSHLAQNSNSITLNVNSELIQTRLLLTYDDQNTFTASVIGESNTLPAGEVIFFKDTTQVGSVELNGNGAAILSMPDLISGVHNISAIYSGNDVFASSQSNTLPVAISTGLTRTTTQLSSLQSTVSEYEKITLTAIVTVDNENIPATGNVTFQSGGVVIGTSPLNTDSQATLTIDNLKIGTHNISAIYSGDAANNPSASAPLTIKVTKSEASDLLLEAILAIIIGVLIVTIVGLLVLTTRKSKLKSKPTSLFYTRI